MMQERSRRGNSSLLKGTTFIQSNYVMNGGSRMGGDANMRRLQTQSHAHRNTESNIRDTMNSLTIETMNSAFDNK